MKLFIGFNILTAAVLAVVLLTLTNTFGSAGSTGQAAYYSGSPITPMAIPATGLPTIPAVAVPLTPTLSLTPTPAPTPSPTTQPAAAGFNTPTYWPDLDSEELERILETFSNRQRRFGRVNPED